MKIILSLLELLRDLFKNSSSDTTTVKPPQNRQKVREAMPVHPWRLCPAGQHWVIPHPMKGTKGRRGHCRKNPSRKDQIYEAELEKIAEKQFGSLAGPPKADNLGFPEGNKFDVLIRGWTRYWNEVFKPNDPLDPNLVKALIATESRFHIIENNYAGKRAGYARGLMQVTDWSIEILKDEKGELQDYLVNVDQNDMSNACLNIAAGVRWIFRKRETASAKLKRPASWIWAVADYKAYFDDYLKNPSHTQMNRFIDFYERLKKE